MELASSQVVSSKKRKRRSWRQRIDAARVLAGRIAAEELDSGHWSLTAADEQVGDGDGRGRAGRGRVGRCLLYRRWRGRPPAGKVLCAMEFCVRRLGFGEERSRAGGELNRGEG